MVDWGGFIGGPFGLSSLVVLEGTAPVLVELTNDGGDGGDAAVVNRGII